MFNDGVASKMYGGGAPFSMQTSDCVELEQRGAATPFASCTLWSAGLPFASVQLTLQKIAVSAETKSFVEQLRGRSCNFKHENSIQKASVNILPTQSSSAMIQQSTPRSICQQNAALNSTVKRSCSRSVNKDSIGNSNLSIPTCGARALPFVDVSSIAANNVVSTQFNSSLINSKESVKSSISNYGVATTMYGGVASLSIHLFDSVESEERKDTAPSACCELLSAKENINANSRMRNEVSKYAYFEFYGVAVSYRLKSETGWGFVTPEIFFPTSHEGLSPSGLQTSSTPEFYEAQLEDSGMRLLQEWEVHARTKYRIEIAVFCENITKMRQFFNLETNSLNFIRECKIKIKFLRDKMTLSSKLSIVMAEVRSKFLNERCLWKTVVQFKWSLNIFFNSHYILLYNYNSFTLAFKLIVNFVSIFNCFTVDRSYQCCLTTIVLRFKFVMFATLINLFIKYQTYSLQIFVNLFFCLYRLHFSFVQFDFVILVFGKFLEGEESAEMWLRFLQLQRSVKGWPLGGLVGEKNAASHAGRFAAFDVAAVFGATAAVPARLSRSSAPRQCLCDWIGILTESECDRRRKRRLGFVRRYDLLHRSLRSSCRRRRRRDEMLWVASSPVCVARLNTVVSADSARARNVCRRVAQQSERCANVRRLLRVRCSKAKRLAGYKLLVALRHALLAVHLRCVVEESRLLLSGVLHVARSRKECPRVRKQDAAGIDLSSRLDKRKIEQLIARVRKKDYLIRKSLCGWEWRPWLIDVRSRAKSLGRMLPQLQIAPAPGGVMGIATPRTGVATSTAQIATTTPGVAFQPHVATLLRSMAAAATSTAYVSRAELLSTITISTHSVLPT